ncbi:hypothetical protein ACJ72_00591 [Emergomyces africanus]|uniref:SGNH hydrolase-type esterase domain-containing protein n=1 Tax=Emergomyces africanus TaxID=1955775 RepID=A0A1B7P7Q0_9EURO|nr:hypothetical protein ACJ72_00591 [Emergomyces africanus]
MYQLSTLLRATIIALLVVVRGINCSPVSGLQMKVGPSGIRHGHWVAAWASMPQLTEPTNLPPRPFVGAATLPYPKKTLGWLPAEIVPTQNETGRVFFNSTIRQTLHMSIGSDMIRVRISNAFGAADLPITAVTVALPGLGKRGGTGASTIREETLQALTFSGSQNYTIPSGALAVSDPINFRIKPESVLTISIYLADGQKTNFLTSHPDSLTTSHLALGNYISAQDLANTSTQSVGHWYFVSAVEAWAPPSSKAFVIIGDSITDGTGSDTDMNNRWPDRLLHKMRETGFPSQIAVISQAANGNRLLNDGRGPNALSRIDRDVISLSGVAYAMVFEGVNDIGNAPATTQAQVAVAERIISAYKQIITRIHSKEIPVFGATIAPFMAPNPKLQHYSEPARNMARQKVNTWIRTSGAFDAVVDFDMILADPKNPDRLLPRYDSVDYLHPSVAGYQAMADAFPLNIFLEFENGTNSFSRKKP